MKILCICSAPARRLTVVDVHEKLGCLGERHPEFCLLTTGVTAPAGAPAQRLGGQTDHRRSIPVYVMHWMFVMYSASQASRFTAPGGTLYFQQRYKSHSYSCATLANYFTCALSLSRCLATSCIIVSGRLVRDQKHKHFDMECLRRSQSLSASSSRRCGASQSPILHSQQQHAPARSGHTHATPAQIVRPRSICNSIKKGDAAQALNGLKTGVF